MKVIRPNCRIQFTAEDVAFILNVLGTKAGDPECLTQLLADQDSRDLILDDESLFRAVLQRPNCLRISTHFYFYVLVRHVFARSGLRDRGVADYVGEVLAEFSHIEATRCVVKGQPKPLDYFVDMLAALQSADDVTSFYIRAHIGNHSLFLSGVFPERIRARAERRGSPDLSYYEEVGRANYRMAGDHRLAREYDLAGVFGVLSEQFKATRLALNDLADRLVSLGDADSLVNAVLKAASRPSC